MISEFIKQRDYFIFNGIRSDELGIVVQKMPDSVRAKEKIIGIDIPGRSGRVYESEGAFDNYTLSVECLVTDLDMLDQIANLYRGTGEVIFSDDLTKKYKVAILNQIDLVYVGRTFKTFLLQFDVQPFKYAADAHSDEIVLTESGSRIFNHGTYYSEPIITIEGTGSVALQINGKTYHVQTEDEAITINSEIMEVYHDGVSKNHLVTFEDNQFPTLQVGENQIELMGNITKVIIQPNWRYL